MVHGSVGGTRDVEAVDELLAQQQARHRRRTDDQPVGRGDLDAGSADAATARYREAASSSMSARRCRLRSGTSLRCRALTTALSRDGDSIGRLHASCSRWRDVSAPRCSHEGRRRRAPPFPRRSSSGPARVHRDCRCGATGRRFVPRRHAARSALRRRRGGCLRQDRRCVRVRTSSVFSIPLWLRCGIAQLFHISSLCQ